MGYGKKVEVSSLNDDVAVVINEFKGSVSITLNIKVDSHGKSVYINQSVEYKLKDLSNIYKDLDSDALNKPIYMPKEGEARTTRTYDAADAIQDAGRTTYIMGVLATGSERFVESYGRFAPMSGYVLPEWEHTMKGLRWWKLLGNNGSKTVKWLFKNGQKIGYVGAAATIGSDIYGITKWYNNPSSDGAVHPAKAAVDVTMTAIGLWGGPWGAAISIVYFGVDSFYPGGWIGIGSDLYDGFIIPLIEVNESDQKIQFIDSPINTEIPDQLLNSKTYLA